MAFITTAFTYLIIFITSIIVAIRLWFKYNEFKLKRQYARQHLKYVKVPNTMRIEIEDFQAFLTVASDEKWKRLRIDDSAITLMKNIDAAVVKSNVLNIKEFFGNYTMDAIMQVAFGVKSDSHSDPENKIVNTAKLLFSKDVSFAEMAVLSIVFAIPGVLALMSKASAKASDDIVDISTDEIIAQVVLFFLSAYDTTTTAISLTTYLLALHPKVQDKLHTEIDQFLQNLSSSKLAPRSRSGLPYLNAVLSESLRLYPPGTFTERMASKDLLVQTEDGEKQFEVKAGDIIRIPIYALHMDEEQWPSASTFDPSRFLSGSSDLATYHKYAYLPFSQGPRNCVARSLALYESKIALLHLFANYQVKTCAETDIPVNWRNDKHKSAPSPPIANWHSDTEFFWFLYKLIQANLTKYFANKTAEATEFVKCLAKLHSESMCAELVPSNGSKKGKSAPPPPPSLPRPANDAPTPETLTTWSRDSEFYSFLYQLLLRNKGHFKAQLKQTDAFIAVISKLQGKTLTKEFQAAPAVTSNNGSTPEKFKVIELAEENARLLAEVRALKAQLGLSTPDPEMNNGSKNGTLRGKK
ncbi:Cytochrome P450 3A4, partial [Tyrophagus putrescentiae]